MNLVGASGQRNGAQYLYDASGTIGATSAPQLVLPKSNVRSSFLIQNISSTNMYVEIGGARATASLTGNRVSSCSVSNSGFGYSKPPSVVFYGGAYINTNQITPTYTVAGLPDYYAPSRPAQAHCVMTGAVGSQSVQSIVIDDGGSGYCYPPYVFLLNDPNDPYGCATPSTTSGILLLANGGSYNPDGTITTTDQVSLICASSGAAYTVKYTL